MIAPEIVASHSARHTALGLSPARTEIVHGYLYFDDDALLNKEHSDSSETQYTLLLEEAHKHHLFNLSDPSVWQELPFPVERMPQDITGINESSHAQKGYNGKIKMLPIMFLVLVAWVCFNGIKDFISK